MQTELCMQIDLASFEIALKKLLDRPKVIGIQQNQMPEESYFIDRIPNMKYERIKSPSKSNDLK